LIFIKECMRNGKNKFFAEMTICLKYVLEFFKDNCPNIYTLSDAITFIYIAILFVGETTY